MTYKAHFDGHAIVLDEPAPLVPGQAVSVEAVAPEQAHERAEERKRYFGIFKDMPMDGRTFTDGLRSEWEGRP